MKNKTKKDLTYDVHQNIVALSAILNHMKGNKNYYFRDQNYENIIDVLIKLSQLSDEKMEKIRNKTAYIK